MYQQPGDPNQPDSGSNYPPYYPPGSPNYPPPNYPSGPDQPIYAPPPPPTYYSPQPGAPAYPPTPPPYDPYGQQQPTYPNIQPGAPNYQQSSQPWPGYAPTPPPQQPRKSNIRLILISSIVLLLVIIAGIVGAVLASHSGTANTNPTPTAATGNTPTTSAATPTTTSNTPTSVPPSGGAQVGQTVQAGANFAVTVNSATTSTGDSTFQPKSGNTYLVVDVTVKNTSTTTQIVSSLLNFELRDSTGQKYDESFVDSSIGTPPDNSSLLPGKSLRGQLTYEVPMSMHQFTLAFIEDITNNTQVTWNITD